MKAWKISGGAYSGTIVVGESNAGCPAYTREEWRSETPADFEWNNEGGLVFQGQAFACDAVRTCHLPDWAITLAAPAGAN